MVDSIISAPCLINPQLSKYELDSLISIIEDYINSRDTIALHFKKISSSSAYRNRKASKKITLTKFHNEVKRCWDLFPKTLISDIYNLYFHESKDLRIKEDCTIYFTYYKFLINSNIPGLKILTLDSFLKSSIVTRCLVLFILIQFARLNLLNLDEDRFMRASFDINEAKEEGWWKEQFELLFDKKTNKDSLQSIQMQVKKECQQIDDLMSQSVAQELISQITTPSIGKQKESRVNYLLMKLAQIDIASSTLSEWIKKLLEKSTSYFHQKDNQEFELLLESESPSIPSELHLFHPSIRNFYLEDLVVKKDVSKCSIDLYLDISGSMDTVVINNENNNRITCLDFAKAIALEMSDCKLIDKLYLFNTSLYESDTNQESLAAIKACGGTEIDIVLSQIVKHEKNAIVITDGMDNGRIYTPYAYFVGVKGANFKYFEKDVIKQYSRNEQAILFDGRSIHEIGPRGEIKFHSSIDC